MAKNRISKRRKITCITCGKEQSAYSSNRTKCHDCLPKCKERHTVENLEARRKQKAEEAKEE